MTSVQKPKTINYLPYMKRRDHEKNTHSLHGQQVTDWKSESPSSQQNLYVKWNDDESEWVSYEYCGVREREKIYRQIVNRMHPDDDEACMSNWR